MSNKRGTTTELPLAGVIGLLLLPMLMSGDARRAAGDSGSLHAKIEALEATQARLLADIDQLRAQLSGPQAPGMLPRPETSKTRLPSEPVSLAGARAVGSRSSRVAMIIYSDFQCPYCGRFARDTWPQLESEFARSGKVLFAFRHLPLTSIHAAALEAGTAAECAGRQDRFWPMHDLLFADPRQLDRGALLARADRLSLDKSAFESCLNGPGQVPVRQDAAAARTLGITSTPTFLIGAIGSDGLVHVRQRISGAKPLAAFTDTLNAMVAGTRR